MKGKSTGARRALLDQVKIARNLKIEADVALERHMLKTQEQWMMRNVEDKMAIKARYQAEI